MAGAQAGAGWAAVRRRRAGAAALAAACGAAACSPALDWRDLHPPGAAVALQFPCKPTLQERSVALAGPPVKLALHACAAGGATWALAQADVGDPARVAPALAALAAAAAANVGATPAALQPQPVPGATPSPAAGRLQAAGHRPDGAPLTLHALVFARGTQVLQATVLGERPEAAAVDTFFGSVRAGP